MDIARHIILSNLDASYQNTDGLVPSLYWILQVVL